MFARFLSMSLAGALIFSILSPISAIAQRSIANPSLETPVLANNLVQQTSEGGSIAWLTSHPVQSAACSGSDCRPIELWSGPANANNGPVAPATGAGNQWAELNAFNNSMIYQPICMTNGESFSYSFLHRGRVSAATADVMQFRIGIPSGLPTGSKAADPVGFVIAQAETTNNGTASSPTGGVTVVAAGNGWGRYSGTYTYTGATQSVNLGFAAVSSVGGVGTGNFIDNWVIALSPYFELNGSARQDNEGTSGGSVTPANGPGVLVTGEVTTPLTIRMTVNGGTAIAGTDYSLSVPFTPGLTTNTVDVVVPAGIYNTSNGNIAFPFSVFADTLVETDESVSYSVSLISGGATLASTASCGATPISSGTYTIVNDDLVPTAANVVVSGLVSDQYGRGLKGAVVRMISFQGQEFVAVTNTFGRFIFNNVPAGADYLLRTNSKAYSFDPVFLSVNDSLSDLHISPSLSGKR